MNIHDKHSLIDGIVIIPHTKSSFNTICRTHYYGLYMKIFLFLFFLSTKKEWNNIISETFIILLKCHLHIFKKYIILLRMPFKVVLTKSVVVPAVLMLGGPRWSKCLFYFILFFFSFSFAIQHDGCFALLPLKHQISMRCYHLIKITSTLSLKWPWHSKLCLLTERGRKSGSDLNDVLWRCLSRFQHHSL